MLGHNCIYFFQFQYYYCLCFNDGIKQMPNMIGGRAAISYLWNYDQAEHVKIKLFANAYKILRSGLRIAWILSSIQCQWSIFLTWTLLILGSRDLHKLTLFFTERWTALQRIQIKGYQNEL